MKGPDARGESLERWLHRKGPGGPGELTEPSEVPRPEACLDAETAAAWLEGGLPGSAIDEVEHHLAGCGRCQAMIAALVRMDVPPATPEPVKYGSRWAWRRWSTWALPLTATATAGIAIAVWLNLPPTVPMSGEPAAVSSAAPAVTETDRLAAREPVASVSGVASPALPGTAPAGTETAAAKDLAPASASPLAKAEQVPDARKEAANAMPSPAAPQVLRAPQGTPAPQASIGALADSAVASGAGAPADSRRLGRVSAPIELDTPDRSVRWRLTGSLVQRSIDQGRTWTDSATGVSADFTAGSAPGPSVCWLVGRAGIVLLTTDGTSWRRLTFPEPVDLSRIEATDARTAAATTADGRVFRTTDGGVRWTPQ